MGYLRNKAEVQFAVPTAAWQVIAEIGVYKASTGGAPYMKRAITQALAAAQDGADVDIPAGMLVFEMDVSGNDDISEDASRDFLKGAFGADRYIGFIDGDGNEFENAVGKSPAYARVRVQSTGWEDFSGAAP